MYKKMLASVFLFGGIQSSFAAVDTTWCVYDPAGVQGDITRRLKDVALQAQRDQVNLQFKVYQREAESLAQFQQKKCSGLVATNFHTRSYNAFMGSTAGVGFISNNRTAQNFIQLLDQPALRQAMRQGEYEVAGFIPLGMAYMMLKTPTIYKVTDLKNKKIGVLSELAPQSALVRSVRAQPVALNLDTAIQSFKNNQVDILPIPIYGLLPYNLKKEFGESTRVINFPVVYAGLNIVIRSAEYPANFGTHLRQWFSEQAGVMIGQVIRWENRLPAYYWMDVSASERQAYDVVIARVRNQYSKNYFYDPRFVKLIKKLRCKDEPQYFECQTWS
ncbi:putative solute-binding protein [Acinetobacter ihumii]|uniref:putative solute-binding protein n=1 Tax=Acinetobacter ihumii TaxID=2483802 RepID=UPI001030F9D2|nr:putative solute-binding protein [Acinetobacter ihumii]